MPHTATRPNLHVGIIMDGNGRWARAQGLARARGHEAGVKAIRPVISAASGLGVGVLTLYAFSSDNWRRPPAEVALLMTFLQNYLAREVQTLVDNGVRLSVIGRRDRISKSLARAIAAAERATADGTALHLRIAFDYSGRQSILAAAHALGTGAMDAATFSRLVTGDAGVPDVDLIVRTGGEQRLSDFLLWESAYAELFFTPLMWPDFRPEHLGAALADFYARERRYGGLPAGSAAA